MNRYDFHVSKNMTLVATLSLTCYLIITITNIASVHSHTLYAPINNQELISPRTANPVERLKIRSVETLEQRTDDSNRSGRDSPLKIGYETRWFNQNVDHFSWANNDTFKQRYLINQTYWCGKNCPILFYCGNEGDIEVFTNNTGWMWENAENLHAMLVFAEHRYYGKSIPYNIDPTKVDSNNIQQLGYLSSEQALADFATLLFEIKNHAYDAKMSPVIAIGGSYGGMLAAWMRMKYPNVIEGALAGSAPIFQFPEEYDCNQFLKIVTKDYETYSPNCSVSIARSWQLIRDYASGISKLNKKNIYHSPSSGLTKIGELFNTCEPLRYPADVDSLLSLLNSIWVNMAMTDYANEANFLSKMPAYPIKHACAFLDKDPIDMDSVDLIKNIALASQIYTNYSGQSPCLNLTALLYDPMDVMWDFQSCTEMVMPICSDGINDMFEPQPFSVDDFVSSCKSRWGVETRPDNVRTLYGDRDLSASSNIIFSTCSRDPWSAGCPQESIQSKSVHAIKIDGVCHHEDLRASGPNDPAQLKKARQDELNIISDWIKEYYQRLSKTHANESLIWSKND